MEALQSRFGFFHSRPSSNAKPRHNLGNLLKAFVEGGLCDGQVLILPSQEVVDAEFYVGSPRQFLCSTERDEAVHRRDPAALQEL